VLSNTFQDRACKEQQLFARCACSVMNDKRWGLLLILIHSKNTRGCSLQLIARIRSRCCEREELFVSSFLSFLPGAGKGQHGWGLCQAPGAIPSVCACLFADGLGSSYAGHRKCPLSKGQDPPWLQRLVSNEFMTDEHHSKWVSSVPPYKCMHMPRSVQKSV